MQKLQNAEVAVLGLSSNCNSRTGWKWLNMLHQINIPPPMDLPSEILILTLKISPSNNHCKPSLQILNENNAVKEREYTVGDRNYVGQVLRSEICSKGFLTDLLKERKLPPLKNNIWKWCCETSTATPCNTTLYSAEITL